MTTNGIPAEKNIYQVEIVYPAKMGIDRHDVAEDIMDAIIDYDEAGRLFDGLRMPDDKPCLLKLSVEHESRQQIEYPPGSG